MRTRRGASACVTGGYRLNPRPCFFFFLNPESFVFFFCVPHPTPLTRTPKP